jgi:hypothetical protein
LAVKETFLCSVFAFMLICMSGCMVTGVEYTVDEPLNEARIEGIQRAETTKQEILTWFGPPVAIARQGTTTKIPPPDLSKKGYEEVSSETFFELFSAKHEITEDHIIYYYYYREVKGSFAAIGLVGNSKQRLVVSKLWILINDTTGIVEDYLLRTSE